MGIRLVPKSADQAYWQDDRYYFVLVYRLSADSLNHRGITFLSVPGKPRTHVIHTEFKDHEYRCTDYPSASERLTQFRRYFDDKVAGVRASTSDAPPQTFTPAPSGCQLLEFRPLTADDIVAAVRALPDKQCMSDPLPTRLLKNNVDVLAPFLVELYNRSLSTGVVPAAFKAAYVLSLIHI